MRNLLIPLPPRTMVAPIQAMLLAVLLSIHAVPTHAFEGDIIQRGVGSFAFSSDGEFLATAGYFGIQVWRLADKQRLFKYQAHQTANNGFSSLDGVMGIEFLDKFTVVSVWGDGRIVSHQFDSKKPVVCVQEPWIYGQDGKPMLFRRVPFSAFAVSPDRKTLAAGVCGTIQFWDLASGRHLRMLGKPIETEQLDVDELIRDEKDEFTRRYVRGYLRQLATYSDKPDPKPVVPIRWRVGENNLREIRSLAYSPDGRTLAAVNADGLEFWDLASGARQATFQNVGSFHFSPDGQRFATGAWSSPVSIRDFRTGKVLNQFHQPVKTVFFAHDAKILLGVTEFRVFAWDVNTGELLREHPQQYLGQIRATAIDPAGKLLASSWSQWEVKRIRLWNIEQLLLEP